MVQQQQQLPHSKTHGDLVTFVGPSMVIPP
jgi:hypothetical protein